MISTGGTRRQTTPPTSYYHAPLVGTTLIKSVRNAYSSTAVVAKSIQPARNILNLLNNRRIIAQAMLRLLFQMGVPGEESYVTNRWPREEPTTAGRRRLPPARTAPWCVLARCDVPLRPNEPAVNPHSPFVCSHLAWMFSLVGIEPIDQAASSSL